MRALARLGQGGPLFTAHDVLEEGVVYLGRCSGSEEMPDVESAPARNTLAGMMPDVGRCQGLLVEAHRNRGTTVGAFQDAFLSEVPEDARLEPRRRHPLEDVLDLLPPRGDLTILDSIFRLSSTQ